MRKTIIFVLTAICLVAFGFVGASCSADSNGGNSGEKKETTIELSLEVGQSYSISTNYEYYELIFTSENPEIATVNVFGDIKALAEGSTRVIANIGNHYIYYNLTVNPITSHHEESEIIVYTVSFDKSVRRVLNGGSFELYARVTKNGQDVLDENIEWSVVQDEDILSIVPAGNTVTVCADSIGKATVVAAVSGYSASCTVISYSADIQALDFDVNVVQGERVYWENVENAESIQVSFDDGITWETYATSGEITDFGDEPEAYNLLVKAVGDDCYYETSEIKTVFFRNKMNLYFDGKALTLIPLDSTAKYNLYNDDVLVAGDLTEINLSSDELFDLTKTYALNLQVKTTDSEQESNSLRATLHWNRLDFEDDCNLDLVTATQMTDWCRAPNDGSEIRIHENGGSYLLKGIPTGNMATFKFNFGRILQKGTTIRFSLYVSNTDDNCWGWFPIVVNGTNQSWGYAYWVNQNHWSATWYENTWTLESDADHISICCNFGEFYRDGGNALDLSKLTVYIDNVMIIEPKTSFGFESLSDLNYVSISQMTGIERVANDGTEVPVHTNGGSYLLKGTPTGNMATFTINFGTTISAGTTIKFSLYVANEDDNVWGWFPIVVNGKNQSSGYAYWVNQGHWSATWYENTWTLESDAESISICCNFGEFYRDGGNNLDITKIRVYLDNVEVV